MAGRGATTFQKRQKEQQRKERQQQKFEKRIERKRQAGTDRPMDDSGARNADARDDASGS
jgi:hypothetical protein